MKTIESQNKNTPITYKNCDFCRDKALDGVICWVLLSGIVIPYFLNRIFNTQEPAAFFFVVTCFIISSLIGFVFTSKAQRYHHEHYHKQ